VCARTCTVGRTRRSGRATGSPEQLAGSGAGQRSSARAVGATSTVQDVRPRAAISAPAGVCYNAGVSPAAQIGATSAVQDVRTSSLEQRARYGAVSLPCACVQPRCCSIANPFLCRSCSTSRELGEKVGSNVTDNSGANHFKPAWFVTFRAPDCRGPNFLGNQPTRKCSMDTDFFQQRLTLLRIDTQNGTEMQM
jgi:hypothetical protein